MSARIQPLLRATGALRAATLGRRMVPALRPTVVPLLTRSFTSTPRHLSAGQYDAELSEALALEHKYEMDLAKEAEAPVPEWMQKFKDEGIWEIQDAPGSDHVKFVRKFGNETITLSFLISDVEEPSDMDSLAERTAEDGTPIEDVEDDVAFPPSLSCSALVTKSGESNALSADLEAGEEGFAITNVAMFDKKTTEADGAEGDWIRRSKYIGPRFEHLDNKVQAGLDAFFGERGVDEMLAQHILMYCEHKEQKDYVKWLQDVKKFVDA